MGDPSGIGPAIALKAAARLKNLARLVIIGDKWVLAKASGAILRMPGVEFIDLKNVRRKGFSFGEVRAEYGRASVEYLDKAVELQRKGLVDCIVTCPISKEAVNLSGCRYTGHTEYFAKKTGTKEFLMFLLNDKLKFVLMTRHIPLKEVSSKINKGEICKNIALAERALKKIFLIRRPRIVVCGLNPHASDNGLLGCEENKAIRPAIKMLKDKSGIDIEGPLSADVAIGLAKEKKYDCVIAMYHDQALIPLRLTSAATGANLTYGLPFIRTSPLHGTAFDIAKRPGLADPSSLIAAIKLALTCTSNLKKD